MRDELGIKPTQQFAVATAFPDEPTPSGRLTDDAIALSVARKLPANAIVCDEAVTSARRFFALSAFAAPHDYMMGTGGSIGGGIPMATGAAIACPDRKVINLEADGSGMYTVQGLWTQAREKLDVVTIVFSNRTYAILHGEMHNVGVNEIGENARRMLDLDHPALDWVALAKGMGVEAARADTCERFDALLDSALVAPGAVSDRSGDLRSLPPGLFARRRRFDRQRMHAGLQFVGQQFVDGAVAVDAAHAGKGRRDDADAKMRLAGAVIGAVMAGAVVVMAGMEMAFVDDDQPLRRKCLVQLVFHGRLYGHRRFPSPYLQA